MSASSVSDVARSVISSGSWTWLPHVTPVQMGNATSPPSNSTQIVEPVSGRLISEAATGGREASAQAELTDAAGTSTWSRPFSIGSVLLTTVARYLP